jgi:hypothetical protein
VARGRADTGGDHWDDDDDSDDNNDNDEPPMKIMTDDFDPNNCESDRE